MKKLIWILALLSCMRCAGTVQRALGQDVQDCVTSHLKIVSRTAPPSETLYERMVDSCTRMYGGRP